MLFRENSSKGVGYQVIIHPINFSRFTEDASETESYSVISFIGPAGSGKSSLLRQLDPDQY